MCIDKRGDNMKTRIFRSVIAFVTVIMSLMMTFSFLTVKAQAAFNNSTREGVVAVVFYVKDASLCYMDKRGNMTFEEVGEAEKKPEEASEEDAEEGKEEEIRKTRLLRQPRFFTGR
jgi:hypothetical protein